jgi:hypothetical protein
VAGASFAVFTRAKAYLLCVCSFSRHGDPSARPIVMKLDFMVCLGTLLAILFVGIVGAFLLYVPALTVITVVTILLGLGLMFALGILTGRGWRKSSPFSHRAMPIVR